MEQATGNRRIRRMARQDTKRSRSNPKQAQKSSASIVTNGFLSHCFLPVTESRYEELKDYKKVEREFFNSLSYLAKLYGFPLPDVSGQAFPLNICNAFDEVKAHMKRLRPELHLFIFQEQTTFLATAKIFDTGTCLYYLSIAPLVKLNGEHKYPQFNILLSLFSYVHQIAGVSFYTDGYSYIGSQYDNLKYWIEDEGEDFEEGEERLHQLHLIAAQGKKFSHKIKDIRHLKRMAQRLNRFKPNSNADKDLLAIGNDFLQLLLEYPTEGILSYIAEGLVSPHEEDRMYPESYLAFMYDYEDCLKEDLFSTISEHLNNCGVIDEPMAFQYFDREQTQEQHDLNYVSRVFELLDKLIDHLKSY